MPTDALILFLQGATTMGLAALALCFLRFYRRSQDRLFLLFALAFLILTINRIAMVALAIEDEAEVAIYAARALAFAVILAAIVDKNRRG